MCGGAVGHIGRPPPVNDLWPFTLTFRTDARETQLSDGLAASRGSARALPGELRIFARVARCQRHGPGWAVKPCCCRVIERRRVAVAVEAEMQSRRPLRSGADLPPFVSSRPRRALLHTPSTTHHPLIPLVPPAPTCLDDWLPITASHSNRNRLRSHTQPLRCPCPPPFASSCHAYAPRPAGRPSLSHNPLPPSPHIAPPPSPTVPRPRYACAFRVHMHRHLRPGGNQATTRSQDNGRRHHRAGVPTRLYLFAP